MTILLYYITDNAYRKPDEGKGKNVYGARHVPHSSSGFFPFALTVTGKTRPNGQIGEEMENTGQGLMEGVRRAGLPEKNTRQSWMKGGKRRTDKGVLQCAGR